MNGSLSNLIDQVINNQKDFVMVSNGDSYHLSTIKMQFKQEELSAVDLGPCEDTLRQTFGLGDQELLIFKVDHEVPGFKIPIIEYVLLQQQLIRFKYPQLKRLIYLQQVKLILILILLVLIKIII